MRESQYYFILRGLLIVSPFIVFCLLAEAFLVLSGEVIPIMEVVSKNYKGGSPGAYMPGLLDQQIRRYRYEQITTFRPRLVALGSSRVQRFRKEMFVPDADFYNASGMIQGVEQFEAFIDSLPRGYVPQVVLIGVDSWWFSGGSSGEDEALFMKDIHLDKTGLLNAHIYAYQKIVKYIIDRKLTLNLVKRIVAGDNSGVKRYGLMAWVIGGFRNDGSNQSFDRSAPNEYVDREHPPVVDRVTKGIMQFVPTDSFDEIRLKRLEDALGILTRKGTKIVGFAPPFSSEVLSAIKKDRRQSDFLRDYKRKLKSLFEKNGWYFYDATEPSQFGMDDRCMEDGFHAMETFHVAFLLKMAENPKVSALLQINPEYLRSILSNPETTSWYPKYD